jgi:hypothetical protein
MWPETILATLLAVGGLSCRQATAAGDTPAAAETPAVTAPAPAATAPQVPPADSSKATPAPATDTTKAAPATPAATDTPPAPESDVDRVLKLAEKAGVATKVFQAEFEYNLYEEMIDENEWRTGFMAYRKPAEAAVQFTDRPENESWRFDGRILTEDRPKQKQRYIHIVRKPQDPPVDILDVGQMPFPQPFGGQREKLLKNYTVTYKGAELLAAWKRPKMKPEDAAPPQTKMEHLELVPKAGSDAAKDYTKVEFWIDPTDGIVRQLRTVDKNERILTVRFKNVKLNDQADRVSDKTFEVDKLPSGWEKPSVTDHTEGRTAAPKRE